MIRVVSISPDGVGHELTDSISGLTFSNTRPGGDEVANFTLHKPWQSPAPEIEKLSTLVIYDGLDVLWQGRIEEHDRGAEETETIDVTAYGLGRLLKDSTMAEIYIDRDLSKWGDPSTRRLLQVEPFGQVFTGNREASFQDEGTDGPAITFRFDNFTVSAQETNEAWYYGGGVDILGIRFDFKVIAGGSPDADWDQKAHVSTDDIASFFESSADMNATDTTDAAVVGSVPGYKYGLLQNFYTGTAAGDISVAYGWVNIRVFGNHALADKGTPPDEGYWASQIVEDVVGRVAELTARRIDATDFVVQQAAWTDPTAHEQIITDVNRFHAHERTWGTWGPDSPLDELGEGQFDYVALEPSEQHWIAHREDCDNIALASETSSLYNRAVVTYADVTGVQRTVTRTATVPALGDTTRTKALSLGKATQAEAETFGDVFLALFGSFAPARGTVTFSGKVRHKDRGPLPAHHMRADGSNLRLADVLPSTTLFALDDTPDRRTTWPIKRVSVDASGEKITTTVEVDQTSDALSALTERIGEAVELAAA